MDSLVTLKTLTLVLFLALKCSDSGVIITYQSKKEKIYSYNCDNLQEFAKNARKVVKTLKNQLVVG